MPATFTKKIASPGTYSVPIPGGKEGETRQVILDRERFKRWAANFDAMSQAGLKIPAPYRHDPQAMPVRLHGDAQDVDAYNNAGFWSKVWVGDDGALYGKLEVPRDEDASKIGSTVVEVSPLAKSSWSDGAGNVYEDAITHIALVTHPVVPGQDNFVSGDANKITAMAFSSENMIAAEGVKLAMDDPSQVRGSGPENVNASTATLQDALKLLREKKGLTLPGDTNETNLIERLVVALTAIESETNPDDDDGITNPPNKSKEQPAPIAMSNELQFAQFNPVTGERLPDEQIAKNKAAAEAAQKSTDLPLSQEIQAQMAFAKKTIAQNYRSRVEQLVRTGRCTPAYANKHLKPLLDDIQLSFDSQGNAHAGHLDVILNSLEALPQGNTLTGLTPTTARKGRNEKFEEAYSLGGDVQEEEFHDDFAPMSDAEVDQVVQEQFRSAGMTVGE